MHRFQLGYITMRTIATLILLAGAFAGGSCLAADKMRAPGVIRKTPPVVAPPIADYSHMAIAPAGSKLIVLAGQIGVDAQGKLPTDVESQFANALANVKRLLDGEGLGAEHIMKVNIWLTKPMDRPRYTKLWADFTGGNPPPLTLAYAAALARPEILVEVEVWAAQPKVQGGE